MYIVVCLVSHDLGSCDGWNWVSSSRATLHAVELDIQIGMEILNPIVMVKTVVITLLTSSVLIVSAIQIGNNP